MGSDLGFARAKSGARARSVCMLCCAPAFLILERVLVT